MSDIAVLQNIQTDSADRLLADPFFSDIPVLTENIGDIENQIEIAVKQLGIVVVLVTPTANVRKMKDAPGPYFENINVVVRVMENVLLNRTAGTTKTCLNVAEHALAILHGYRPTGISESLYADDPTISLQPDPNGLLTYDVRLNTHGGLHYDIPSVADPVIVKTGTTVSITCATPHANIFYSITSYPSPRSGTFYSGPFAATHNTTVKARAWLAGYVTSKQVDLKV